jgi:hypothetical protein
MLRIWETAPQQCSEEFVRFEGRLRDLAEERPEDLRSSLQELLNEMLAAKIKETT